MGPGARAEGGLHGERIGRRVGQGLEWPMKVSKSCCPPVLVGLARIAELSGVVSDRRGIKQHEILTGPSRTIYLLLSCIAEVIKRGDLIQGRRCILGC